MNWPKRRAMRGRNWVKNRSKVLVPDYKPLNGKPSPTIVVEMQISNEFWTGKAIWRRLANVWACIEASKEVEWMRKLSRDKAKVELLKRGCSWTTVKH